MNGFHSFLLPLHCTHGAHEKRDFLNECSLHKPSLDVRNFKHAHEQKKLSFDDAKKRQKSFQRLLCWRSRLATYLAGTVSEQQIIISLAYYKLHSIKIISNSLQSNSLQQQSLQWNNQKLILNEAFQTFKKANLTFVILLRLTSVGCGIWWMKTSLTLSLSFPFR